MFVKLIICFFVFQSSRAVFRFYPEGEEATIECSGEGDVQYWFLDGQKEAIDVSSMTGVYVNENGSLHFDEVMKEHHGSHICVTKIQEKFYMHKTDMNVRFKPPQDLWEARYKGMFITGLIAAIVCFVFFAGICLVNKYRWRDPEPDQKSHLVREAHINPGMIEDEVVGVRM